MTNYDDVWGAAAKGWRPIPTERQNQYAPYLAEAWNTVAWAGMICFFIFGVALLVTRSDVAFFLMGVSLAVWITAGSVVIRIRRKERKLVTSEDDHD
jgi:hypothetical protein